MNSIVYSFLTAATTALTMIWASFSYLAPILPPIVGSPDVHEARSITLPAGEQLVLRNGNGSITVLTQDVEEGGTLRVVSDIRIFAGAEFERVSLDGYVENLVDIASDGGLVTVYTNLSEIPEGVEVFVDYTLYVPKRTDIEIHGVNGNIRVAEGFGHVAVRGSNSDIEIREAVGDVWAKSVNGRIRVTDIQGESTLETVNGNIYANIMKGSLNAISTNGYIDAELNEASIEGCTLNSKNGGIHLRFEELFPFTLDATSGKGVVNSEIELDEFSGTRGRNILQGKLGSGDMKLNLGSLNGNITITRR